MHAEVVGPHDPGGPADPDVVVLVHGFTQTGRCWGPFADDLARDHRLVLVDAPGHGGSARVEADLPTAAELIGAVGGPGTYLGYSMGGRMALHLALARPDLVEEIQHLLAAGDGRPAD